ncbi:hypothetical protein KJ855_01700 [Patescibacteria group bacterium]|nr:hypothetical protein [Patescibacteria group bacterium]
MKRFDPEKIKAIVRALKGTIKCPHCQGLFCDKDMELIAARGVAFVVRMSCGKCGMSVLASLVQIGENNNIPSVRTGFVEGLEFEGRIYKQHSNEISSDDLISLHQYLKDFDGDFKSVFEK